MDVQVESILNKIAQDSKNIVAIASFFGVIAGAIITVFGSFALQYFKDRYVLKRECIQKKILKKMLEDNRFPDKWRDIDTLSAVIGENEEKTKQLLIEIDARGSERIKKMWGLIKNHPIENISH